MNTKQMIVLWYVGLAAVWALLMYADSQVAYGTQNTFPILPILICIVIVGGLLFATFRSSERIDQKKVLLYSLGPPTAICAVFLGIFGVMAYFSTDPADSNSLSETDDQKSQISVTEIELVDPCLRFEEIPYEDEQLAVLVGRIRNHSNNQVESVSVNVRLHEKESIFGLEVSDCGMLPTPRDSFSTSIDGQTFTLNVNVPAKATRSFTSNTDPTFGPKMRPTPNWRWSYRIKSVD